MGSRIAGLIPCLNVNHAHGLGQGPSQARGCLTQVQDRLVPRQGYMREDNTYEPVSAYEQVAVGAPTFVLEEHILDYLEAALALGLAFLSSVPALSLTFGRPRQDRTASVRCPAVFHKGKFCIVGGRPVNKGVGMLQMSGAKRMAQRSPSKLWRCCWRCWRTLSQKPGVVSRIWLIRFNESTLAGSRRKCYGPKRSGNGVVGTGGADHARTRPPARGHQQHPAGGTTKGRKQRPPRRAIGSWPH